MRICFVLIPSGCSFGKAFVKNSNSLLLLRFFKVSVEWSVIKIDDYTIFTEEILKKYCISRVSNIPATIPRCPIVTFEPSINVILRYVHVNFFSGKYLCTK